MKQRLLSVLCVTAAAVAATACSTQGQVDPDVMQIATTPLTCSSKAECDLWWQRAQTRLMATARALPPSPTGVDTRKNGARGA